MSKIGNQGKREERDIIIKRKYAKEHRYNEIVNSTKNKFRKAMAREHFISIESVLAHSKNVFKNLRKQKELDSLEILKKAIDEIEMAVHNPEINRQRVVEKFLWAEPYCFCLIPNFAEIEEESIRLNDWTCYVKFPLGDGCVVTDEE